MMAAPNLIAAAIIPQIKNAKICVWGTPPNLEYPNRLAEEYAMLDVLSQGRLEVAFPLGTGMEYWANPINPATARERHRRIDRHHSASLDAGRPNHLLRRFLHLPLPQSVAAALSETASASSKKNWICSIASSSAFSYWAKAWHKGPGSRHELLAKLGGAARNFRDPQNPNLVGLIFEVPDVQAHQCCQI